MAAAVSRTSSSEREARMPGRPTLPQERSIPARRMRASNGDFVVELVLCKLSCCRESHGPLGTELARVIPSGYMEVEMADSTKDKIEGAVHDVKGTIKEKVGQATKNPDLEDEGTA